MIRVNWDVEELVALIDVYHRCKDDSNDVLTTELKKLSSDLEKRAVQIGIPHDEKFRNYSGVYIMYQNVVFTATAGAKGMSNAGYALKAVYKMSILAPEAFALILNEFQKKYCN